MSLTTTIALGAAAVLVVLWLVVSFTAPSPRRVLVEMLATTALFLALGSWFIGLSLNAHAAGHTALLIPFGFLAFVFSAGLCVSTWRTLGHLLRRSGGAESATH